MIQSALMIATLLVASVSAHYIPEDCVDFKLDPNTKFASVYNAIYNGRIPNEADIDPAYQELDTKLLSELTRMHICLPGSGLVQGLLIIAYESKKYDFVEGANPERLLAFYMSITKRIRIGEGPRWHYSTPTNNLFASLLGLENSKEVNPMLVQRAYLDYLDALESWASLDLADEYRSANDAHTLLGYITAISTNQLARTVFPSCNQKTLIDSGKIPELSEELQKSVERRADMYRVNGLLTYQPNVMVG